MLNYAILLVAFVAFSVLVVAWSFASSLGDAFRDLPLARLGPARDDTDQLTYARRRPKPDLVRDHPSIAVIIAIILTILTAALPLGWPFLLGPNGFPKSPMIPATVGLLLVLASLVVLSCRALRRSADGVPAGAYWPRQRLRNAAILSLLAVVPLYAALSIRTSAVFSARLREADQASSELRLRDVSPEATSECERLLGVIPRGDLPQLPEWDIGWHERDPAIPIRPPAFPPEHAKIVEAGYGIARNATLRPRLGSDPVQRTILDPYPYGAQRHLPWIMRAHAADALAQGNPSIAIHDLTTLHTFAALEASSANTTLDASLATAADRAACDITQMFLPLVHTPQELEPLAHLPAGWHRPTLQRALRGERAVMQRSIIRAMNGSLPITVSAPLDLFPSQPYRVLLGEADLDQLATALPQPPAQAMMSLPDAIAWGRSLPGWGEPFAFRICCTPGGYTTLLAPEGHRFVQRMLEMEALRQLQQIGIAATRYRLKTGRLPTTLDAIASTGISPDLLTDPYTDHPVLLSVRDHEIIVYLQSLGPGKKAGVVHVRIADTPLWDLPLPAEFQPAPGKK